MYLLELIIVRTTEHAEIFWKMKIMQNSLYTRYSPVKRHARGQEWGKPAKIKISTVFNEVIDYL